MSLEGVVNILQYYSVEGTKPVFFQRFAYQLVSGFLNVHIISEMQHVHGKAFLNDFDNEFHSAVQVGCTLATILMSSVRRPEVRKAKFGGEPPPFSGQPIGK